MTLGRPTCKQIVPGSSWGTFTIACTIPIALFVGLYMYRLRKGRVVEASLIGAVAACWPRSWPATGFPARRWNSYFSLTKDQTVLALCIYGFIASVLPVWLLLCPRDYLSSFLKIGTIALLVVGVSWPIRRCRARRSITCSGNGGPTFPGRHLSRSCSSASCAAPSPASTPWSRPARRRR